MKKNMLIRVGLPAASILILCQHMLLWGQVQSSQDGRALDANFQIGGNGYNTNVEQYDFNNRNNLVTGNVTNYQYFRGDIGYSAPGEILDTLQSNDLFRFQADSFSSNPVVINNPDISNLSYTGYSLGVYRSLSSAPVHTFSQGTYFDPNALTPFTNSAQLGVYSLQSYSPYTVLQSSTDSQSLNALESSFGRPLEATYSAKPPPGGKYKMRSWDQGDSEGTSRQVDLEDYDVWWSNARRNEVLNDIAGGGRTMPSSQSLSPTAVIGQRLQAWIDPLRIETMIGTDDQQLQQLQESFDSMLDSSKSTQYDDIYLQVLDAIKRTRMKDRDEDTAAEDESGAARKPSWQNNLDSVLQEPSRETVEQAEKSREQALRKSLGLPETVKIDELLKQALDSGVEKSDPLLDDKSWEHRFDDLISTLSYDMVPLDTLVGERESRVNQLMKEAESQFDAGNFFSAEGLYRQAINESPERPMIRVGLIHAQLGAGMIRSAAFNLRTLYNDHPELISLRYASNLLPPAKRLQWLQQELQDMISDQEKSSEPGLIMAYLGYQVSSRQLVRYGLAIAEADLPRDTLLPVLRHIWLGEYQVDSQGGSGHPAK